MTLNLPAQAALLVFLVHAGTAAEGNWGRWGTDDQVGTLNYITPQVLHQAARTPRHGRIFSLALPIAPGQPGPERTIRLFVLQRPDASNRQPGSLSESLLLPPSATTHWDGLGHIFGDGRLYNGYDAQANVTSAGALKNGIHHSAGRVTSRGILLDIARLRQVPHLESGYVVSRRDLEAAAEQQGVTPRQGDIILIRTGWMTVFERNRPERFRGPQPGIGWEATQWLKEVRAAAVAVDNLNAEVSPRDLQAAERIGYPDFPQPVTFELIRNQGMLVGQLFMLEALARDCAADGIYEFFFSATPLRIVHGISSPTNPIAVK